MINTLFRFKFAVSVCIFCLSSLLVCNAYPKTEIAHKASLSNIHYHTTSSDTLSEEAIKSALQRLAAFRKEISHFWGFPDSVSIEYIKCSNKNEVGLFTGNPSTGRALFHENRVFSIHESDAHEVAHIITMWNVIQITPKGKPANIPNFWLEGIAMHYTWPEIYLGEGFSGELKTGFYGGKSVHQISKGLFAAGETLGIRKKLYRNCYFGNKHPMQDYALAGSFVSFLIKQGCPQENIQNYSHFLMRLHKELPHLFNPYLPKRINHFLFARRMERKTHEIFVESFGVDLESVIEEWIHYLMEQPNNLGN